MSKSNRPRISLLTGLLAIALAGAIIYGKTNGEKARATQITLESVRAENAMLRAEVGYLEVEDETQIYARAVSSDEHLTWRWRVFLPHGWEHHLHGRSRAVPAEGSLDDEDYMTLLREDEQFEIRVRVLPGATRDEVELAVITPGGSFRSSLRPEQAPWAFRGSPGTTVSAGVMAEHVVAAPGEPFELLRLRHFDDVNDHPADRSARPGLLLWITSTEKP